MYCIECGKANPEGAKFCAYCGVKLFTGEPVPTVEPIPTEPAQSPAPEAPEPEAQQTEPAQPEPAPEQNAPAPETKPYARMRHGRTLQPTMENPAQPDREPREPAFAPEPMPKPEPEPEPEPENGCESEPEMEDWWNEVAKPVEPKQPIAPPEDLWADLPGDDEPEPGEPKKKFVFPWQRDREENMVLTSSGTEEMPSRKPVITRKKRDTRIPERIVKPEEPAEQNEPDDEDVQDIFFMRPKKPRRQEEESIDDAYVNSRVRTILFAIGFVTCLFVAVWLFATSSGQMFLAGFNLSSSAEAYRDLGDSALANNQVKRAAEAYYRALSLDPDDYDTALLVGKTQQQIGEYDTAADAYYMCTQLRPNAPEPYEALVRLYEVQNEPEKAEYFRDLGAVNAGIAP